MTEVLLHAYCDGLHYRFVAGSRDEGSIYGGPQERTVKGKRHGPHDIHQVAELAGSDIPLLLRSYAFELPLLYGFRFDGCQLKYRFSTSEIEVLSIDPKTSAEDWPYSNYPSLLPYAPLKSLKPLKRSWAFFGRLFPNMELEQPADLVAVAEPPFTLGFSMWGKGGDREGVCVVFECDLSTKSVTAYNLCS